MLSLERVKAPDGCSTLIWKARNSDGNKSGHYQWQTFWLRRTAGGPDAGGKLDLPYYDRELLDEAAKDSGICQELIENHDEKPIRLLLFSMVTGVQMHGDPGSMYMDMPLNHRIFLAQFDAIRRIASEGPCVIVGRCADYVLRDKPNAVSVFVKADIRQRVERAVSLYGVDPARAEETVRKADKQRASYYNYYATAAWNAVNNNELCVDTGKLGIEDTVELMKQYLRLQEQTLKEREGLIVMKRLQTLLCALLLPVCDLASPQIPMP